MTDKSSIQQVLGSLIHKPQLLSEVDKYSLAVTDFSTRFEKYIFLAILGLYRQGATHIEAIHIANFLEADTVGKKVFEQNNGIEYVEDIKEFSNVENFPYYYNRLKKINLLRDLKRDGFDTEAYYCENLTDPKADEINARFENLTAKEICDDIKGKLIKRESEYVRAGEVETQNAAIGMRDFVREMNETIALGPSLQGHIYSQVFDGAMKTALYIRSGSSGLGKTRQAVGDACRLAYPVYYSSEKRKWVQVGNCERVLFIITDQTFPQIKKMILAYLSDISDSRFKLGNFTKEEEERLDKAISIMEQFSENMIIVKIPNPTIELVKTLVRENCLTHNIGYVFYDYIFIGPALLGEFRGFSLRNDEVLLMFATALKDLAVELNVAMFTSTQVNASADDNKNIRNEASLAGGRSTINKADNGAIMARPTNEELEILQPISAIHGTPNLVTDIFKARSGEWTQVRIWSQVNLGTLKKKDLYMTDSRFEEIPGFVEQELYEVRNWDSEQQQAINTFVDYLNERN